MLFLPAAALCCLCSALVAMAAELIQDDLTLTRRAGKKVSFSCGGTNQCDSSYPYVYWYQKIDTETFTRILSIDMSNGNEYKGFNHPQKNDFSGVKNENVYELKIQTVKLLHSATYYCSCWKDVPGGNPFMIFGSGTKLFVTVERVVKPVVSVYPAASRAHLEGKSSLLCLASAMSPPVVQFSWKRQKNGQLEDLPPAAGERLELREPGRTASILLLHQQERSTYKYRCSVKHEGGTVRAQTEQDLSTLPSPTTAPTATPTSASTATPPAVPSASPTPAPSADPPAALVPSQYQVKLLCVLYTVLIVKSLVYCCGLSLLMILRNKGPSTNCTHAD
ncbi:immunoglobulin lambda-1 light chain-like [Thunnus maccoyii]|uniref:immunoglobulin lambda-1 light chain-like n=1 Tax=Thunnus maccoyii TaxID=8240 RepID=UPI001C4C2CFF|nr:immunoglobulin lambda-1 light chain-like [Thunnus maccoyii]